MPACFAPRRLHGCRLLAVVSLALWWFPLTLQAGPPRPVSRPTSTETPDAVTVRPGSGATPTTIKTSQGAAAQPANTTAALESHIVAAETRCGGAKIEHTELSGCLGTRCQDETERGRFVRLTGLQPGEVLRPGMLANARLRLEKTRFFGVVFIRCQRVGDRARLSVGVVGNSVIRRVRFVGNQALFTAELRNKVQLQPGDVLNPNTDETRRTLEQQTRSIQGAYAREGFDDVKVQLEVTTVGVGQVELVVRIDEGERKRVVHRNLQVIDPHQPTPRERAAGLVCQDVSERALLRVSGLNTVDVFTRRAGVRARSQIRVRLRQLGYGNPRVSVTLVEADQVVQVRVQLGRCNVVRIFERESAAGSSEGGAGERDAENWRITDEDDYTAVLPFTQSGVFDVDEADRGRRALTALLENRGYFFSDVTLEVRDVPQAWTSRVRRAITYHVTTGYRAQIRGLHFPGAKHFTRAELLEGIVTRPYDFFDDGGYLQTAQLLGDLDRLRAQYRSAGFFEFRFDMAATESTNGAGLRHGRKTVRGEEIIDILLGDHGFRVRRPVDEHFIYIDVPLTEGRRTRLGTLVVDGPGQEGRRRVRGLFGLKNGEVLSFTRMVAGVRKVEDWYQDRGFFQAKVEVQCRVRGAAAESLTAAVMTPVDPCLGPVPPESAKCPPRPGATTQCEDTAAAKAAPVEPVAMRRCRPDDWCACTEQRILGASVDVRLQIQEGPRVRIGEVFVSGNFITNSELLTGYMPKYDALYSGQVLFEALRKIRNLGVFRSVSIQQIGADECPPRRHVALVVRVVENDRTTIDLDAGLQTANVNRDASNTSVGEPPLLLVDALEHLVAAGARLNTGSGQRVGATLPKLVLTMSADWRNRNFRGEGEELRGVFRVGVSSDLRDLATQPFSLGLLAASWTNSHLPYDVSLKVIPFASRDFVTTIVDVDKIGVATEISKRFLQHLSLSLGAEGGFVSYRPLPSDPMTGFNKQLKVIPRGTWDRLNSPINPTRGVFATTSIAYINAIIEDGDKPTANQGNFLKFEAQLKWYGTLRDTFTLALTVRGGTAMRLGDKGATAGAGLPSNETFRLGGQLGLRGVTDNGVLQYGRDGAPLPLLDTHGDPVCAGENDTPPCSDLSAGIRTRADGSMLLAGTVEGRFPLIRRAGLWGAAFWDWGVISDDLNGLSYGKAFRHGVGLGLRYLISGQIPVRIDYGVAVDRRCTQPFKAMGQRTCAKIEEFGQLQVGLLYAF